MNKAPSQKLHQAIQLIRKAQVPPESPVRQAEHLLMDLQKDIGPGKEVTNQRREDETWGEFWKRMKNEG